ncbi:MAG TPA: pyruvate kinase [Candidatus Paceibacterota bacterium]|nr:pyruvate kinase [Candidatus Paceibacterota bacterium]
MTERAQIVATIGPASEKEGILPLMVRSGMDLARFNFEWLDFSHGSERVTAVRDAARSEGRAVKLIADLPGPRIQLADGHTYDASKAFTLGDADREMIRFAVEQGFEYVAVSFIASAADVGQYREALAAAGGNQKLIAKIERKAAVGALSEIIAASDAVMVARGDLSKEVPIEELPFVQRSIVAAANESGKPVIVATGMLLSMTENLEPARSEVTDVELAVLEGADATMLSEETAAGKHPVEAIAEMERLLVEAGKHRSKGFHHL